MVTEFSLIVMCLDRALQTKKDGAVYDSVQSNDRIIASGLIVFDHVGRQVEQYYPVDEQLLPIRPNWLIAAYLTTSQNVARTRRLCV